MLYLFHSNIIKYIINPYLIITATSLIYLLSQSKYYINVYNIIITKLGLCDLFIPVPPLPLYLPAFCLELLSGSTTGSSIFPPRFIANF